MPNSGSERGASLRKQDTTIFSGKLPSTKKRFSSPATTVSACPSFRICYYDGAASAVPFEWESHPGTPKNPSSELPPPPPLTPPPSHFSFSGGQIRRGSRKSTKKILALIPTWLLWLSGDHNNKIKKLSASSPFVSERVLINDDEYDLFKFPTERKVMRRFLSFDSFAAPVQDYPIRRSQSTSCFGIRRCFIC